MEKHLIAAGLTVFVIIAGLVLRYMEIKLNTPEKHERGLSIIGWGVAILLFIAVGLANS